VKRFGKYRRKLQNDMENMEENSDKIWTIYIWKKRKLNSDKIWKVWKKNKLNSEMTWKGTQGLGTDGRTRVFQYTHHSASGGIINLSSP
jgi:hypothetical protein